MFKKILVYLILISLLMLTSCAYFQGGDKSEQGSAPALQESVSKAQQSQDTPNSNYYDFEDILIPSEMELQADESIIFQTPSLKSGNLVFKGKVEPVSLFNFFMHNMPQDNWSLRSYFKYNRYLIVFEKADKVCVLRIKERNFNTLLYVWVSPSVSASQEVPINESILNQ